jgi:2'-5' RNA ligase
MNRTHRLFYAFELTDAAREQMAGIQEQLVTRLGRRYLRWTQPIDMHITALFLGSYSDERLPMFDRAGADAVLGLRPFDVSIRRLGKFPRTGPVSVLWAGPSEVDATALSIAGRLREAFQGMPIDRKPFNPHITVARTRPDAELHTADTVLREFTGWPGFTFAIERLALMETVPAQRIDPATTRDGAISRYRVVNAFALHAADAAGILR